MHYLNARFAVLAAAMTFSITPLGWAAWASGDKPVVSSMTGMNSIMPLSGISLSTNSRTLVKYKETYLAAYALVHPAPTCTEVSQGAWTVTTDSKYGKVTLRTLTGHFADGECPGITFTFAAIYYEWTAHNNKTISDTISDTFNATWQAPGFTLPFTFNIDVPEVRPDHETTAFVDWDPKIPTIGRWRQTLVPPANDPKFDFSGKPCKSKMPLARNWTGAGFLNRILAQPTRSTGARWLLYRPIMFGNLTALAGPPGQ